MAQADDHATALLYRIVVLFFSTVLHSIKTRLSFLFLVSIMYCAIIAAVINLAQLLGVKQQMGSCATHLGFVVDEQRQLHCLNAFDIWNRKQMLKGHVDVMFTNWLFLCFVKLDCKSMVLLMTKKRCYSTSDLSVVITKWQSSVWITMWQQEILLVIQCNLLVIMGVFMYLFCYLFVWWGQCMYIYFSEKSLTLTEINLLNAVRFLASNSFY